MRQKAFLAHRKHQKRRKRARQKVKLFEQGKLKREQLPRLARKWVARKRRLQARTGS